MGNTASHHWVGEWGCNKNTVQGRGTVVVWEKCKAAGEEEHRQAINTSWEGMHSPSSWVAGCGKKVRQASKEEQEPK